MSFEVAQAQYDAMAPPDWAECPVCVDLGECAGDFEGARRIAAYDQADRMIDEARGN